MLGSLCARAMRDECEDALPSHVCNDHPMNHGPETWNNVDAGTTRNHTIGLPVTSNDSTVSECGLVAMTLLMLAAETVVMGHRPLTRTDSN